MNPSNAYTIRQTLFQDDRIAFYRGVRDVDSAPVLIKVLRADSPAGRERLRHEYELCSSLRTAAVVVPIALEILEGRPALILEDFGGEPLERMLGSPTDLATFLDLSARIAAAVAAVHRADVVHRDLKPQHILFNAATLEVRLTGFELASRLAREQPHVVAPRLLEGSLPYMSPEQTGRMNRIVDSRSDLYSLGVIFYQMLSGQLPFEARDPPEWVHYHVARAPVAVSLLVPQTPEVIARMIMKLLAKTAEDRYQTAAGLLYDLRRCSEQWYQSGTVGTFPLGRHDVSDRLQIPQRLYGRDAEVALLLGSFERVVKTGTPELLLVSGYAGIGKSALVHELHRPVVRERGRFLGGKFDQYTRNIPYSTIAHALTELVRDLLAEDQDQQRFYRRAIEKAIGGYGKLLVEVIPHLQLLLGEQPPVPDLPAAETERRFLRVFRAFLSVFTRKDHPLVLFLDDLQWADTASLRLLEDLIVDDDTRYLLLIGSYRDNEVSRSHALVQMLDRVRSTSAVVTDMRLAPLGSADLARWVADTVCADAERARPLAALVHEKTGGNPFFAIQFLCTLYQEKFLTLDKEALVWRWDIAQIRNQGYTDNVVEFLVKKLSGLPAAAQAVLRSAACLGNKGSLSLVALLQERSVEQTVSDLWDAIREGLVLRAGDEYAFVHDRVQQAAYALLPEERRGQLHLRIGRLLLLHTPPEKLDERLFAIVTQLNLSGTLSKQGEWPGEWRGFAELNLRAARKAKASAAYRAATTYLAAAVALLPCAVWTDDYELAYAICWERAECEFLSGNLDEAERLLPALLGHARSRLDRAAAYRISVDLYTTVGETVKAIESAFACLRMFGIDMSLHPPPEEVEAAYQAVWRDLGARDIGQLIELPLMTDPEMLAAMDILALLYAPTYHFDNNLLYLHICHAVCLSLRHGNAPASTHAYGWFGVILIAHYHRYQDGFRFARVAYELMDRRGFVAFKAKINLIMEIVSFWNQPIDRMLDHLQAGFSAAIEAGDVPAAAFCCSHRVIDLLTRGDSLADVHREAERGMDFVRKAGFRDVYDIILSIDRYVQAMRGQTHDLSTFDDETFSEAQFESQLDGSRISTMICWYYIMKLVGRYMAGDYAQALVAGRHSQELIWSSVALVQIHDFYFYYALALCAAYPTLPETQQADALSQIKVHQRQLEEWAQNYPPTFHNMHVLLSAELARLERRTEDAMHLYEVAISAAREGGFVQNEGLSCELAANFYRARRFDLIADTYLRAARQCYARWGAEGKVRQLDRLHPELLGPTAQLPSSTTIALGAEQLDLLSVVKASQTISGEILLDQLARTLLKVVLEQGGAQLGYLVLCRDGALSIAAKAELEAWGVEARILQPVLAEDSVLVPLSVLRYAQRTHEHVILDDPSEALGRFSGDPYLTRRCPKSVLCLPILRQGEVSGLLYLENNLLRGAFTAERLRVLELLAAQAAISLENAQLVMREQAARLTAQEQERRSAFLVEAGGLLGESLQIGQILGRLAELVVRHLADWCAIDLVDGEQIRREVGRHADSSKQRLLDELQRCYAPWPNSPHPAANVLRTGQPMMIPHLHDTTLRSMCVDDEHHKLLCALGIESLLCVPLTMREQVIGAISMASARPSRSFGRQDLELAVELAYRAAMAIDNARLYYELQEAVRVRDEFLSIASHELRTPVTSLHLAVQGLRRGIISASPEILAKTLHVAEKQTTRLTSLIEQLLDISRLQAGRLQMQLATVDLTALVQDVVARFREELLRAGCTISLRVEAAVTGRWDASRLDQVITNLLSNAIKFCNHRPIELTVAESGGIARLVVRDYGIGIAADRLPHIFKRFERAVSSRHFGGLGLGLYIVQQTVLALGGSVCAESTLGEGSTFTIELPCAGPPLLESEHVVAPAAPPAPAETGGAA